MSSEQTQQTADDPSDDRYWRNVLPSEILQPDDMMRTMAGLWLRTTVPGKFASDGCGRTYRRRIEPQPEAQPQPQPEPQATQDDPSGPGWRDVLPDELLQPGDMFDNRGRWERTGNPGITADEGRGGTYRRRIEATPDDPSGPGWRDVGDKEPLQSGDMYWGENEWQPTQHIGVLAYIYGTGYRRRIEPPQPSDSEPETMEDLRRRLAECEVLLAEAGGSGEQVNAELQQLREQVTTLTWERDRYRNQLAGAIEHSSAAAARQQVLEALQTWLRPVLELVAEHPEDASPLAVAVLGFLPGIASRLIEE